MIEQMRGKSLINCYLDNHRSRSQSIANVKRIALTHVNLQLQTFYEMKHIDNWVAGRMATPKRVKEIMQLSVLQDLFDDETALTLHHVLIS